MRTLISVFGLVRVLVPVLYCGGLLFYFFHVSGGSIEQAEEIGLGPTILGLAVVGFLFCIPLIIKVGRMLSGPRSPGSGGGPNGPTIDDDDGFDADAAVARYMAQRSAEPLPHAQAASSAYKGGGQTGRPGFGRRIK